MSKWTIKRRTELAYQRAVTRLLEDSFFICVTSLSSNNMLEKINEYIESQAFADFAQATAGMMVSNLFGDIGRSWREAARLDSNGRLIYDLLMDDLAGARGETVRRIAQENAQLIKSLPASVADDVTAYIMRETLKGRRPEDIEKDLHKLFPKRSKARAKLIARTEAAKTQTALLRSDCDLVGAEYYFWRSSHDARTRHSNSIMDGVLCSWHDPPNPERLFRENKVKPYGDYHPGETFNCRCYAEPLVSRSQVTENSYRMHQNGRIVRVTKADLLKLI